MEKVFEQNFEPFRGANDPKKESFRSKILRKIETFWSEKQFLKHSSLIETCSFKIVIEKHSLPIKVIDCEIMIVFHEEYPFKQYSRIKVNELDKLTEDNDEHLKKYEDSMKVTESGIEMEINDKNSEKQLFPMEHTEFG
jgi:hypothetical protein